MTNHGGDIRLTPQEILNESYDWMLSLMGIILWGYDDTPGAEGARRLAVNPNGNLEVVNQDTLPTDPTKINPTLSLRYDNSGNLQYIDKVIGGVTYTKTLTYVDGNLTNISPWV